MFNLSLITYTICANCNSVHLLDNSDLPNNLSQPFLLQQECYIVQKLCIKYFRHNYNNETCRKSETMFGLPSFGTIDFFLMELNIAETCGEHSEMKIEEFIIMEKICTSRHPPPSKKGNATWRHSHPIPIINDFLLTHLNSPQS